MNRLFHCPDLLPTGTRLSLRPLHSVRFNPFRRWIGSYRYPPNLARYHWKTWELHPSELRRGRLLLQGQPHLRPWRTSPPNSPTGENVDIGTSDSDSSVDDSGGNAIAIAGQSHWCFVRSKHSGWTHVASVLDAPGTHTLESPLDGKPLSVRPCCAAQVDLDPTSYVATKEIPTGFIACRRLGCRSASRAGQSANQSTFPLAAPEGSWFGRRYAPAPAFTGPPKWRLR